MIGSHLGERYELTLLLQETPLFSVYFAKDKVLGRDVTVRLIKPPFNAEPHFMMKLREVVQHAGSIEHAGVERLLGLEDDTTAAYLVSETSKGAVLAERIKKLAPYSVPVSVAIVVSILDGLEAIHNSGYVHGDPGAHNIIVQPDGAARLELPGIWEAYAASETAGAVMLPAMAPYLAPEISAGGVPTPASDVYAVGVILFQLLTGRHPYPADTPVAMAMRHASAPTPSARSINPAVPVALDEFVKRAMAKEPSARYRSATQMLSDLHRIDDSVRFGKTAPVVEKPQPARDPSPAPVPVASATNARPQPSARAAEAPKIRRATYEEPEPRDVPVWMIVSFTFVFAVVVALVGLWFWFNSSAPRQVTVPQIKGKELTDAQRIIGQLGLQLRVSNRETSEKFPVDAVLDTNPAAGQQVKEGGTVTVKVSAGSRLVTVPDLRGKSPEQARDILSKLNLDLDRIDPVMDSKVEKGLIVRQSPDPKSKAERFSRINIGVSSGPATPNPAQPGPVASTSTARFLYTVIIRLTKIDEPVVLRVDITDATGTRKIYEAQHYPNDKVKITAEGFGEHAVFRIYYNGEYVTQVYKQADENATGAGNAGPTTTNGDDNADSGDNPDSVGNSDSGDGTDTGAGQ